MRKVTIEVLGGVAEVTSCPEDVEVKIIDHDNINECDGHVFDEAVGFGLHCVKCGLDGQDAKDALRDIERKQEQEKQHGIN